MPETQAKSYMTSTLSAVVTHADGTTEDLGVISTTEVPPKRARLLMRLLKKEGKHVSR